MKPGLTLSSPAGQSWLPVPWAHAGPVNPASLQVGSVRCVPGPLLGPPPLPDRAAWSHWPSPTAAASAGPAPHAVPSQSPWGSTRPLVTFFTFFTLSIAPDVVTLSRERGLVSRKPWARWPPLLRASLPPPYPAGPAPLPAVGASQGPPWGHLALHCCLTPALLKSLAGVPTTSVTHCQLPRQQSEG